MKRPQRRRPPWALALVAVLAPASAGARDGGSATARDGGAVAISGGGARVVDDAALDAELTRLQRPGAPLPAPDVLRALLEVPTLDALTLRERANALRIARRDLAPAPLDVDGGLVADGGVGDAGVSDGGVSPEAARLDALLVVLTRVLHEEMRAASDAEAARAEALRFERERARDVAEAAESARVQALREAQAARTSRIEALLARSAELEGLKAEIARARGALIDADAAELLQIEAEVRDASAAHEDANDGRLDGATADRGFRDVLGQEQRALARVRAALDGASPVDPAVDEALGRALVLPGGRLASADDEEEARARERMEEALRSATDALAELVEDAARRRLERAKAALDLAHLLDDTRIALLDDVSPAMSRAIHGLDDIALENVNVALDHVVVSFRYHGARRAFDVTHLTERTSDLLALGRFVLSLGWGLVVLALALLAWRRAPKTWPRLRAALLARTGTTTTARALESALALVEEIAPRAFRIALVAWIGDAFHDVAPEPELSVVVDIILWVLAYRLAARLLHLGILRLLRRRMSLTAPMKLRILRTVRLVLRYGFLSLYVLAAARALVGTGVLFGAIRALIVGGAVPLAIVLLARWRQDIVRFYLARWPSTALARLVEKHREDWQGFFFAVLAFGVVFVEAALTLSRDFVLGFDQTRKALAYLFRLRIERQAKQRGRPTAAIAELPPMLLAAFDDTPVVDEARLVTARVASAEAEASRILETRRGRSVLVDAPWGCGLTTWLLHVERSLGAEAGVRRFAPTTRVTEREALVRALGAAISGPDNDVPADVAGLAERILVLDLDLVVVDGLEWLFLRELGGYEALDTLLDVVRRTRHRVSWHLASSTDTVELLSRTRHIDTQVTYHHTLDTWGEDEIRALIQERQRKSGVRVSFEDLLVSGVDAFRDQSTVVETEEGYIRLIWNFASGNPTVAQHFWLRSLLPKGADEVSVRLYDAPTADDLESLPEVERFMLAATMLHRALTPDEIVRTCRVPHGAVDAHVGRGLDLGFYVERAGGTVEVTTAWHHAVSRLLRRKNLA